MNVNRIHRTVDGMQNVSIRQAALAVIVSAPVDTQKLVVLTTAKV